MRNEKKTNELSRELINLCYNGDRKIVWKIKTDNKITSDQSTYDRTFKIIDDNLLIDIDSNFNISIESILRNFENNYLQILPNIKIDHSIDIKLENYLKKQLIILNNLAIKFKINDYNITVDFKNNTITVKNKKTGE